MYFQVIGQLPRNHCRNAGCGPPVAARLHEKIIPSTLEWWPAPIMKSIPLFSTPPPRSRDRRRPLPFSSCFHGCFRESTMASDSPIAMHGGVPSQPRLLPPVFSALLRFSARKTLRCEIHLIHSINRCLGRLLLGRKIAFCNHKQIV